MEQKDDEQTQTRNTSSSHKTYKEKRNSCKLHFFATCTCQKDQSKIPHEKIITSQKSTIN